MPGVTHVTTAVAGLFGERESGESMHQACSLYHPIADVIAAAQ